MAATQPTPYLLSIEPIIGTSFRLGFHLGTDLKVARSCAVDRFNGRNGADDPALATRTVALLDAKGGIVDVYDGTWNSDLDTD